MLQVASRAVDGRNHLSCAGIIATRFVRPRKVVAAWKPLRVMFEKRPDLADSSDCFDAIRESGSFQRPCVCLVREQGGRPRLRVGRWSTLGRSALDRAVSAESGESANKPRHRAGNGHKRFVRPRRLGLAWKPLRSFFEKRPDLADSSDFSDPIRESGSRSKPCVCLIREQRRAAAVESWTLVDTRPFSARSGSFRRIRRIRKRTSS
jgi:hypothetical protein